MPENEDSIFFIDSSSLIILHRYYPPSFSQDVWDELNNMFKNGRVLSNEIVYNELTVAFKKPDALSKWVSSHKKSFLKLTHIHSLHVSDIIKNFPGLIDPNKEKDEADPWLIAQAIEENKTILFSTLKKDIYVLSEENVEKPQKIPAVCNYYGIEHLNLLGFFKFNGWDFVIKTT